MRSFLPYVFCTVWCLSKAYAKTKELVMKKKRQKKEKKTEKKNTTAKSRD
jgi:phage portal protein BeeE